MGNKAVEERCTAVGQCAQRRFRADGNTPARHMKQFRTMAELMQQRPYVAGPGRGRCKTAAKSEPKEAWEAR